MRDMSGFICRDCGVNTCSASSGEYYMLHDSVWKAAGDVDGMLCIGCVEARLGRELSSRDFRPCPLNQDFGRKSPRLRDRLRRLP